MISSTPAIQSGKLREATIPGLVAPQYSSIPSYILSSRWSHRDSSGRLACHSLHKVVKGLVEEGR
eukprot:scaffold172806_cov20-Prasinocladus_malaysianus.AAC.1